MYHNYATIEQTQLFGKRPAVKAIGIQEVQRQLKLAESPFHQAAGIAVFT